MTELSHIKRLLKTIVCIIVITSLTGCITNITVPVSWVSNTRLDVKDLTLEKREITGQATSHAILFGLIAWGDSGRDAAIKDAKAHAGFEVKEAYDVKTDQKIFNILGLYLSRTIIITAKAAR